MKKPEDEPEEDPQVAHSAFVYCGECEDCLYEDEHPWA